MDDVDDDAHGVVVVVLLDPVDVVARVIALVATVTVTVTAVIATEGVVADLADVDVVAKRV